MAQLAVILETYSDEVIAKVCHPLTGVQRKYKTPPSMAAVSEICEDETERLRRIQELSKLKYEPSPRVVRHMANVLVPRYSPQYAAMCEKAKTGSAREWKWDEDGRGIWVALGWLRGDMGGTQYIEPATITPELVMQKLGITQEQWDKIPDLPEHSEYWRGHRKQT